jgi:hypothetical protein
MYFFGTSINVLDLDIEEVREGYINEVEIKKKQ